VPNLISLFRCLGRARESVHSRGPCKYFATHIFFYGVVVSTPYPPYLKAVYSIRNPRTRRAVVTVDPLKMALPFSMFRKVVTYCFANVIRGHCYLTCPSNEYDFHYCTAMSYMTDTLMCSDGSVVQLCISTINSCPFVERHCNRTTYCNNGLKTATQHICSIWHWITLLPKSDAGHVGYLPTRKNATDRQTDRPTDIHGHSHKVFFAHAREI
jgi:hypothetical protein